MPENLLCMQLSHIRYANMDFFKTPHIQIQLLGKDPVFKYEFLVLFIYPWEHDIRTSKAEAQLDVERLI